MILGLRSSSLCDTVSPMKEILRYRGRSVTPHDVDHINGLIAKNPTASRRRLSVLLCESWNWRQSNGRLRDMVCRGLMLQLHRAGHITLPEKKYTPHNPLAHRKSPSLALSVDQQPIETRLSKIQPLIFKQVRRSPDEKIFNGLIQRFHYLGYTQPVGEHLKYIIYAQTRPIACMAWSSAPRHIGARDRFIGWNQEARKKYLHLMAYNSRFLILPWVKVKHLASHVLGTMAKVVPKDWENVYNHSIYYLETFVDPGRFKGTCYRAANWKYLGMTKGLGKDSRTNIPNRSLKEVLGYPLSKAFRNQLTGRLE